MFTKLKVKRVKGDFVKDIYELIKQSEKDSSSKLFTIVDGDQVGEKALFINQKVVLDTTKNHLFSKYGERLTKEEETRTLDIEGNRIFCDILSPPKKLVICGAGHVSMPIIKFGIMADFSVTVIDDRLSFADNARKAGADQVYCQDFKSALDEIESDENTYFVIVTRGHRYDRICLEEIIQKPNAYVGMIGSKKRVKKVKEELLEKGADPNKIEKIYTPIGLDIKAETPVEIAIAIMGEIILVKNQKKTGTGYSKEIMKELLQRSEEREVVLATVISRKGSAPREVGTKMLIYPDGRIVGTIGGGCAESDVMIKALDLFSSNRKKTMLIPVDMTGQDAEDDGMVCGGIVEVFLEKI